jgi:hypothetical protein
MADKTAIWDRLGKTDPKHTKPFTRGGGFKGTAIKPMFSFHRMTEEFGACGEGWGVNEPTFQVVHAGDEILVYCTASIWHSKRENIVFGVGGDKVVIKQQSGLRSDDEAFKKAFTDAVTNALKLIGVGADVHMGLFDDSKYVNEVRQEFSARENPHVTRPSDVVSPADYDEHGEIIDNIPHAPTAQKLRVADQRPLYDAIQKEALAFNNSAGFMAWMRSPETIQRVADFKPDWQEIFRGTCKEHLADLREGETDTMRMTA